MRCPSPPRAQARSGDDPTEAFFRRFLHLANGVPSPDTFGRVFAKFDPQALAGRFGRWAASACEDAGLAPVAMAELVRGHWGIGPMHWALDVVSREDDSRAREGHAGETRGSRAEWRWRYFFHLGRFVSAICSKYSLIIRA
jgi:hypothetical protein